MSWWPHEDRDPPGEPDEQFAWWKPLIGPAIIVVMILCCVAAGRVF